MPHPAMRDRSPQFAFRSVMNFQFFLIKFEVILVVALAANTINTLADRLAHQQEI